MTVTATPNAAQPQPRKVHSKYHQRYSGEQRDKDRLIHVPALQVPRTVEKVQLVSMEAVPV